MTELQNRPVRVFISYSRRNTTFKERFVESLADLEKQERIEAFDDSKIPTGTQWGPYILKKIEECNLFICLVSDKYLGSTPCLDELNYAEEQSKDIFPVIIQYCDWGKNNLLNKIQVVPILSGKVKPIDEWNSYHEGFRFVTLEIEKLIAKIISEKKHQAQISKEEQKKIQQQKWSLEFYLENFGLDSSIFASDEENETTFKYYYKKENIAFELISAKDKKTLKQSILKLYEQVRDLNISLYCIVYDVVTVIKNNNGEEEAVVNSNCVRNLDNLGEFIEPYSLSGKVYFPRLDKIFSKFQST